MSRTVTLAASFPVAAERLFQMYLDPETHAAFTGAEVSIGSSAGSEFIAFDGALTGRILHVEPPTLIVQTWRSTNWPQDAIDSVLCLTFVPETNGSRIELTQINVPEEDLAGVSEGWVKFYWNPWREYISRHTSGEAE